MEEDEDRVLLSNLGVTSANVEDIERNLLEEAKTNARVKCKDGESDESKPLEKSGDVDPSSARESELYSKLRAVQYEIDAVASTLHQSSNAASDENHDGIQCDLGEKKGEEDDDDDHKNVVATSANDTSLQQALAFDRLESLKKTEAQIEEELEGLCGHKPLKSINYDKVIRELVQDKRKRKRKSKEPKKSSETLTKRQKNVSFEDDTDFDTILDAASAGFVETERDELIRKGVLTPFHKLKGFERRVQHPAESSKSSAAVEDKYDDPVSVSIDRVAQSISEAAKSRPTTKILDSTTLPKFDGPTHPFRRLRTPLKNNQSGSTIENCKVSQKTKRPMPGKRWRKLISREENNLEGSENTEDDLVTSSYEDTKLDDIEDLVDNEARHVTLEGGLKIPKNIYSNLFDYQKVGVQWMWELHCQKTGGIIGDEMGLGKTVQVLSFLAALHYSNMYKPSIIVCPVTLLRQWKREAKKWYPKFRAEILHDSARETFNSKSQGRSSESDNDSEGSSDSDYEENLTSKTKKWDSLIKSVLRSSSGLLITSYEQLRLLGEKLLDVKWGYAVLDEGHRVRNPNAEVTLVCKQLQTVHRLIMTGSPIQNKLAELWSLFDFVFPGKLGVLPVFEAEFAVPISVGGYANASPLQVSTAYRCAVVLRDMIMPYLLRRMKADVNTQLPKKTEHVLFCSLTEDQRSVYRAFLASSDVEQILDGSRNSLYGIDVMRKICNHPDLLEREQSHQNPDYGNPERSGKMKVVTEVLKAWKGQGHRALLFAQTQQMLDILECFMIANEYSYRRMDGQTPVKQRMALIDEFNNSDEVFIFLLTTKVGGLGTNLTGANRVILFDPDWNPSTDMQARERAWRIGQTREVTIYRLITRGTIEEKVYHRQIYKHFLTDKILKNPQQRRFFKARELKDLFTFNDNEENGSTETSNIFSQLSDNVNIVGAEKEDKNKQKHNKTKKPRGVVNEGAECLDSIPSERKGKEKAEHNDGVVDEETNILKSLFDAQGIHSAINHDVIINAHGEEKMRLEEQASQVARRAAEALRQSRILRSQDSISVPTWTGKSGYAGAPSSLSRKFGSTVNRQLSKNPKSLDESTSRNGVVKNSNSLSVGATAGKALSSAELLAKIRENQEKAVGAGIEQSMSSGSLNGTRSINNRSSSSSQGSSGVQPEVLIRQICTFIQQRGGSVTSAIIVDHFKDRIPSNDLPLFKNLLKEIATLQKEPAGSNWVLKHEYSQQ